MAGPKSTHSTYTTPYGEFRLRCYPPYPRDTRQPWNAADTLLLEAHKEQAFSAESTLVVNDSHGALSTALSPAALWTDSALSVAALRHNERINERPGTAVSWCDQPPPVASVVLLRIPRNLSLLAYQLGQLAQHMARGTQLLAAGMDKHLSPHTAQVIEKYFGPTERHRGRRKARLFTAALAVDTLSASASGRYICQEAGGELLSLPGVFSGEQLDAGSRLLLQQFKRLVPADHLIDLACGNGVLGLAARQQGLAKTVLLADESALAVASARQNAAALFPDWQGAFDLLHGDGLTRYEGPPADIILCNPPFHSEASVNEAAGRHLLRQCTRHLVSGGQLCVVANRHLRYKPLLARQFERIEQLAQDRKFVVWLCSKA